MGKMRGSSDSRAIWLARYILPHESHLRRWLAQRGVAGFDIDDIVQEAYARLATLAEVGHIHSPKSYFFQTALSLLLQEKRRAHIVPIDGYVSVEMLEREAPLPLQDRQVEAQEELARVNEVIQTLPEKCREVFVLRKMYGLSQREIATKLGLSENTVEKHIGKGVRRLLDAFGRGGKTSLPASMERDRKRSVK